MTFTDSGAAESDETLFERYVRLRAPDDFEELVRRHHKFAYVVAVGVLDNVSLAEEVAQDAFLCLMEKRGQVFVSHGSGSFRAWFLRMVVNVAHDFRRKESRTRARERFVQQGRPSAMVEEPESILEGGKHAELQAVRTELLKLPPEHRLPIVLHFLQGISQTEIAAMENVHQSQISRRITQGLDLLRARFLSAGIEMPTLALTTLLSAEDLLPMPQLSAKSLMSSGAHGSTKTPGVAWKSSSKILAFAVCGVSACVVLWAAKTSLGQSPAKVSPEQVKAENQEAEPTSENKETGREYKSYSWNFSGNSLPKEIVASKGGAQFVSSGGKEDSGAMLTTENENILLLDVPELSLPAQITFDFRATPITPISDFTVSVSWTHPETLAFFTGISKTQHIDRSNPPWGKLTFWITQDYILGERADGSIKTFIVSRASKESHLSLVIKNRMYIDNLTLSEIPGPVAMPNRLVQIFDSIPKNRRTGTVSIPSADGQTVSIVYIKTEN